MVGYADLTGLDMSDTDNRPSVSLHAILQDQNEGGR